MDQVNANSSEGLGVMTLHCGASPELCLRLFPSTFGDGGEGGNGVAQGVEVALGPWLFLLLNLCWRLFFNTSLALFSCGAHLIENNFPPWPVCSFVVQP